MGHCSWHCSSPTRLAPVPPPHPDSLKHLPALSLKTCKPRFFSPCPHAQSCAEPPGAPDDAEAWSQGPADVRVCVCVHLSPTPRHSLQPLAATWGRRRSSVGEELLLREGGVVVALEMAWQRRWAWAWNCCGAGSYTCARKCLRTQT